MRLLRGGWLLKLLVLLLLELMDKEIVLHEDLGWVVELRLQLLQLRLYLSRLLDAVKADLIAYLVTME